MTFAIFLDVVIVALILYRQRMVRRVWPRLSLRLAGVLAVIGLIELLSYAGSRHLSGAVIGVLVLSFVVGAVALGALRAASVRIWRVNGAVLRQGTWLTMGLWVVSLVLHFGADWWIDALHGPTGVASASLLLWLGVTYGVQNAVVHRRAEGLLTAGGAIDAHADVVGGPGRGGWGGPGGLWGGWLGGPGAGGTPPTDSGPGRWPREQEPPAPRRTPAEAIEARAEQVTRPHGGGSRSTGNQSPGSDDR